MSAPGGNRAALERLLDTDETAWLVARVRSRILAAGAAAMTGVVQLESPSAEQRAAIVRLVGRPRRSGSTLRVDLADVEAILRRGPWPAGLADAVLTLTGPVADGGAEREREAAAWEQARESLTDAARRFPGLQNWWGAWCTAGGLKRAARAEAARLGSAASPLIAEELVRNLAGMLDALPAAAAPLSVFARQTTGDAHGLDDDRPLGRLAVAAVAAAFGGETPTSKDLSRREAWAAAGVVLSNVSSTVLSLGVPGSEAPGGGRLATATATALDAMRTARSPVLLTLDQVRSGGVRSLADDAVVHICENPVVVELAGRRWTERVQGGEDVPAPALVCTSGQPSAAVLELLERLTAAGAPCRYHGDFDWGGLRIAEVVRSRVPWSPWRFTAADYREAAKDGARALRLRGIPVNASWDPDLAPAMFEMRCAVEEEAVAELLVGDLLEPRL